MQDGLEKMAAFGLNDVELRFEPVAHSHEFINFRDNAELFGYRWQWEPDLLQIRSANSPVPHSSGTERVDFVSNQI